MTKFSKDHLFINSTKKVATIGITDVILNKIEYVTTIRLPEEGDEVGFGDEFSTIETDDGNIDLICPVSGTILQINEELVNDPKLILDDTEKYWICKISIDDPDELSDLMSYDAYQEFCDEETGKYDF